MVVRLFALYIGGLLRFAQRLRFAPRPPEPPDPLTS